MYIYIYKYTFPHIPTPTYTYLHKTDPYSFIATLMHLFVPQLCFTLIRPRYVKANPLSLQGLTPRLATALQLGFVYPDWLKERLSEAAAHV